MALVVISNNPELSEAFSNPEAQRFLKLLFREFNDPYSMKHFIKQGLKKSYTDQVQQLKKSYRPVEAVPEDNIHDKKAFKTVIRCYDGVTFKVGDHVIDMNHPDLRRLPIGRLYEDDRGLHVRLDLPDGGITWRDLGRVEHQLPEPEIEDDED